MKVKGKFVVLGCLWLALVLAVLPIAACAKSTPQAPSPSPTAKSSPVPSPSTSAPTSTTAKPSSSPPLSTSVTAKPSAVPGRLEQLEAAAKKEGKVVYWASHGKLAPKIFEKFRARYPWLEMEVWDADNLALAEKVLVEARAGKYNVDAIGIAEEVMASLPQDLLAKYEWPNVVGIWPPEALPGAGFYLRSHGGFLGPAYNTKLVAQADVPKSWEDLKDSKWKGKTAATNSSDEAPLALAAMWGTPGKPDWDRSFAFWRDVFKNTKPIVSTGYTQSTTLLGAGEFQLMLYTAGNVISREKLNSKQPIELARVEYSFSKTNALAIMKNAPHPNAARLLADWLTSSDGATSMAENNYSVSLSPQAGSATPNRIINELGIRLFYLPSNMLTGDDMKKSRDFWKQLLGI